MSRRAYRARGYSLIELLVVLAIITILAIASVSFLGDRKGAAVRGVMDEVTGVLLNAQKSAVSSGKSITVAVNGTWTSTSAASLTTSGSFIMDPRPYDPTVASPNPYSTARIGAVADIYSSKYVRGERGHAQAGIATSDTENDYAVALASIPPFSTDANFLAAFNTKLCSGGQNNVTVDGITKRFTTGFCIVVVAWRGGVLDPAGPVGVLVVPQNSATVYRFYRSLSDNTWRRI